MEKQRLTFVLVGHVDHGKSSLIGRILADTNTLPEGKVEKVRKICEEKGKNFEYAFLLDALQEEHEQGVTIDTTKIEFSSEKRNYTIIDAPGHKEFLKNMISGASRAEAAILIIDAAEGVREQSKKHAYILSLLGIKQLYVVINKMDLVDYSETRYKEVEKEILEYLGRLGLSPKMVIPISAVAGDNVTATSGKLAWFKGPTVLGAIDEFEKLKGLEEGALRLPIQDVYKFDDRRIIAGKMESGRLKVGDKIKIYPSNNISKVTSIEAWPDKDKSDVSSAGQTTGIVIEDEFLFKRGQVVSHLGDAPIVSNLFTCNLFWMGKNPLVVGKPYKLKLNTQEIDCHVHAINQVIDSNTLEKLPSKDQLGRHEVGNIVLKTKEPVVFDSFENIPVTGRFVLVDDTFVAGGGIIEGTAETLQQRESVETKSTHVSPKLSLITREDRTSRAGHAGKVLWMTGLPGCGKESIAKQLEKHLFASGKQVYLLDASNIRLSLSSDLDFSDPSRHEHTRRVAEVANLFLNAGFIVIVSIVSPYKSDREFARNIIGEENFMEVFVDAPLDVCKSVNPHGIYTKAEAGEIRVPGVSFSYEKSEHLIYQLNIESKDFDVNEKVDKILKELEKNV